MGEKKRRLAAGHAAPQRHDGRLIAQAFAALERGDRGAALRAFEAIKADPPIEPDALNAAGVLALQLGDSLQAEALLTRAIERNPLDPAYRCHLAIAYRRLGKADLAIEALGVALELDPRLAEAHSNLGNLLRERGDNEAAARSFGRALAIRPEFADAQNGLGQTEFAQRNFEAACASFERALALDRRFHEAWYNLSRARTDWASAIEAGADAPEAAIANAAAGLECILTALDLDRDNRSYWIQFENCVRNLDLRQPVDARVPRALARAIDHPDVDPARLVRPIVSLATTGADMLRDPLLQRLLEVTVIPNALVQARVGQARHALLDECSAGIPAEATLPLPMAMAIAHQAFNTEYAYEESAEERDGCARLRSAIALARVSGAAFSLHAYAIYACYRPLDTLDGAEQIAADLASTPLHSLAAQQIDEPLEERRLRATIPVLTGSVDAVSAAVQSQYEANPYPRWRRVRRGVAHASVNGYLRERFPAADLAGIAGIVGAPERILVAGCGTGRHPVGTALTFPDSSVLAVDLSVASLAYAKRRTQELSIANVEYRQADILAMGAIAECFDVIECTGVLHHLADPIVGWRILSSLLCPAGVMRIGLYSEIARRHVVRAREFVAEQGFAASTDGIRACRAAILARRDDERFARLVRGEDFYSLSGCRDLVFHAREQRFTLPQIARLLPDLGLRLIGFEFPDGGAAAAYRARFPDDRAMADFDRWHEVERARPDTFALMYQFWVRRLD